MLKQLPDPRHQSYITYPSSILLMTRILSSIFYISSMRKTSEELNSSAVIENIWALCGETPPVDEIPYWETVNRYLEKLEPDGLQDVICKLCKRLLRSKAFKDAKVRGKYWQVIIDGTQLHSSRGELDERCLYRIHNNGTPQEYKESYYYVLEAKLVLHPGVLVSIMTQFVDNSGRGGMEKQDCERKACWRLMGKLKKEFPKLPLCLSADSLYACERFFQECRGKGWHYILRFKEGSIPYVAEEYESLRKKGNSLREEAMADGRCLYDYVNGIDYKGYQVNLVECIEEKEKEIRKGKARGEKRTSRSRFLFVTERNVPVLSGYGRRRWRIENEGFNTQKKQGYCLEHQYSRDYQAMKNHYYLIQIGHMIGQVMECVGRIWGKVKESREQKHRRILESFKKDRIAEDISHPKPREQIRLD